MGSGTTAAVVFVVVGAYLVGVSTSSHSRSCDLAPARKALREAAHRLRTRTAAADGEPLVQEDAALRAGRGEGDRSALGSAADGSSDESGGEDEASTTPAVKGGAPFNDHPELPIGHHPRWRWQLGGILDDEGKRHGVEIGVQAAKFSLSMLKMWKGCTKYIVVDAWEDQANYNDAANVGQRGQDLLYKGMKERLEPFEKVVVPLRMWSHDASKKVNDSSLDYIYIDARHDYESVLEDIRDWYPKLRVGGFFAGHDYTSAASVKGYALQRDGSKNNGAVRAAVLRYADEVGLSVHVIPERRGGRKAPFASWLMRKT